LKKVIISFCLLLLYQPLLAAKTTNTHSPSRYTKLRTNDSDVGTTGFIDIGEDPFDNTQEMTFKTLFGTKSNKLELYSNEAELSSEGVQYADLDIFYWHLISPHWAIKGGGNYFYRPTNTTPYWQPGIGLEGTTPFYPIDTNIRVYEHESSVKLDAEFIHDFNITDNFFIKSSIRSILATSTVEEDQIGNSVNQMRYFIRPTYRLTPELHVFIEYEYMQNYGSTFDMREEADEETSESLVFFGLAVDF
jgi:uncharacterized protein involved in copper resistance